MTKMDETIDVLAADIRRVSVKIEKAEAWHEKYSSSKLRFDSHFGESAGKYAVLGLLCVAAMIFDFMVNSRTMAAFGKLLHTNTSVLASILTVLDGFLAIQASGLLDRRSEVLKERGRKLWLVVLWIVAAVKIVLFITFWLKFAHVTVGAQELPKNILNALPNVIFTVVIYAIFHFAGAGLWYIYGNVWYAALRMFGYDILKLRSERSKYESELKSYCRVAGIEMNEVNKQYSIVVK